MGIPKLVRNSSANITFYSKAGGMQKVVENISFSVLDRGVLIRRLMIRC
jgi:hypothetical protein